MKTEQISPEVWVELSGTPETPIIIEAAGSWINISLDELERIYIYCKQELTPSLKN